MIHGSVLSFPDRGPWGDARFHGNCSGHVVRFLIEHYHPALLVDPMEGGGTSRAVAAQMGVEYVGLDLRTGFDLTRDSFIGRLPHGPADLLFLHPPYWNIVPYSGVVWGAAPHPRDLSHATTYESYLLLLQAAVENALSAVAQGGRLAILIGDVRRAGRYYSPHAEILGWRLAPLDAILIKVQHHVRSDGKEYAGNGLIRILHEYLLVFRA